MNAFIHTLIKLLAMCSVAFCATSALALTAEEMFRNPQFNEVTLSKSGRYLAVTTPVKGRMNLMVIDLKDRSGTALTSFENMDVVNLQWVGDERIVYTLGNLGEPTGEYVTAGGLFVISRDGREARKLSPTFAEQAAQRRFVYRTMSLARTIEGSTSEVIVSANLDDLQSRDLYKLNLETGKTTLITGGRPASRADAWILDKDNVPRVVNGYDEQARRVTSYYRANADAPWQQLYESNDPFNRPIVPLAIDEDNKTLLVASNEGRDTMAIFKYDPLTKQRGEQIAAHPRFDMGAHAMGGRLPGVIVDRKSGALIGLRVEADRPLTVWFDGARAAVQNAIDKSLPNSANSILPNEDGNVWLVTSQSESSPAVWYVFEKSSGKLEEVARARPWLHERFVKQQSFRFTTRDGLTIPGYLFLPASFTAGKPVPTVIQIHGGPHVRADFFGAGYGVTEARFLAAHGYAVIVPNFRVTPGLGKKIFRAGLGEIGRKMSEDHEDALAWAVKEGYADPKRACISGASYGGYAALRAVAKTPELFKCAIAGLAPTDLVYQNTSRSTDYVAAGATSGWKRILGVSDFDTPIVHEISPINDAAKINSALFFYGGVQDRRVPIVQMDRMAEALTKAGNPPKEYIRKIDEGHGFGAPENRIELYTKMLAFLNEQLK